MPPEPISSDRKDLGAAKDRKHERSPGADALDAAAPRWRDPYHPLPRRPAPGHSRQGSGYHQVYPDGMPARSGDLPWPEDKPFRASSARYAGGRTGGRESRGSFRRSPYWNPVDLSRQHQEFPPHVTGPRSVAVPVSPRAPVKDQHDKIGNGDERDRSIGWKPHKWTRSCSLKGAKLESDEATGAEAPVPAGKETPIRSPMTSPLMSDDGAPRKKPRLTWGQGLAKHEKQKIEGSSDTVGQSGSVQCASSAKPSPDDTSPKVTTSVAGSLSPATLCSAISSSSPAGLEENLCIKESNNDASHPRDLSGQVPSEEFSIKLDPLEVDAINNLTSLLADLLQHEDACSGDSSFTRRTAMNKLLVLKGDISKELERTECEIDLLEHELKTLNGDDKNHPLQSSFLLPVTSSTDPCLGSSDITLEMPHDSIPSKDNVLVSTAAFAGESLFRTDCLEDDGVGVKNTNDDSPGTASLKYSRPASSMERISDFGTLKLTGYPLSDGTGLTLGGHGGKNCLDAGSNSVHEGLDISSNVKEGNNLIDLIIDSNRNAARKASQVFDKAVSVDHPHFGIWETDYILSCRRNDARVREKITRHRRQCKFKERVLGLKFRAFHHLWKEDLRLLSIRKNRPKSQKCFELCSRSSESGSHRHRSSIRSRFTLPAGNLTLVPTTEMVDFTSKLLSDSQMKLYRENLNMPALILGEMERKYSRFISFNGLVQNPATFEKEREIINPWTQEEREVFMETLATFGKDFTKISSFLAHKTTADCIEFYYKNHKSECFKDVKKRLDLRKQRQCLRSNTYLVTSGKKWNREVNAASLDILGEASAIVAHSNSYIRNQQKHARRSVSGSYPCLKVTRGNGVSLERANTVDSTRHEQEIVAADVLAGICGALSSEAISSCVTSSIDPAEKLNNVRTDRFLTQKVAQNIDEEDTCSDEGCGELEIVDWTDDEKSLLIRALSIYGRDFAKISRFVRTRSREQCKIFFSKARKCLGLDVVHPGQGNGDAPISDMNGGRSDTDDVCAAEIDSAICSTQSCSRMDVGFTQPVGNTSSDEFAAGNILLHSETERSSEQYEVVGTNHEEVGGKVDRFTSFPDDNKLVKKGGSPRCDKCLEENDDTALRCNETVQCHQGTEFVDKKGKEGGSDLGFAPVKPTITTSIGSKQVNVDGLNTEVDLLPFVVPGSGFMSSRQIKVDKDADSSASLCFAQDSNGSGIVSSSGTKVTVSNSLAFAPNNQHQIPLEVLSYLQTKSHIQSKQENSTDLPLSKVLLDPSSIYFEGLQHVACQPILDFEENGSKRHQNSAAKDFYHPRLMGNLSVNQVGNIHRGYPLQVLNHNGVKRDADHISEMSLLLENMSKGNGISQSNHIFPDTSNEKNKDSPPLSSRSGIVHTLKSDSHLEVQLHPCSQNSCAEIEVQSNRTGDVKLFGQILSHPSSQKKSNPSSSQECDSQPLSPIQNMSLTMKPSNGKRDGISASGLGSSDHSGHEELPLRSYGFRDGNRIQTGYPSLSESAILVAKYQGSLATASFYPERDCVPNSNGVLTDFEHPYVKALAADGKKLDSLSELQKRNGFETVTGFHQQGRALLGVNVAGGGILVDAGRGVTNPVAVLKKHYSGRAKILTSEVESWSGDVRGK